MCPFGASTGKKSATGGAHPTTTPNTSSYDQGVLIKFRLPSFAVSPGNTDIRSARLIVEFSAGFLFERYAKMWGARFTFCRCFLLYFSCQWTEHSVFDHPKHVT